MGNVGMRAVIAAAIISFTTAITASSAPWCANDCISLCKKTAPNAAECIANYNCSKYPASPCAGAGAVDKRAKSYKSSGGGLSFDACMRRGTKAGWGDAETARYCQLNSR